MAIHYRGMPDHEPAHQPLKSLSAASLLSILKQQQEAAPENEDPAAKENRTRAAEELAMIFELKESRAFQWFEQLFIEQPYQEAFGELRSPSTKVEDLEKTRTKYLALREIKAAVVEREIAHRQLLAPSDDEIPKLRQRLLLL